VLELEGQADVADTGPRRGQSPRLAAGLVVDCRRDVPGTVGERCLAACLARVEIQRGFEKDLHRDTVGQGPRLELPSEVGRELVVFRIVVTEQITLNPPLRDLRSGQARALPLVDPRQRPAMEPDPIGHRTDDDTRRIIALGGDADRPEKQVDDRPHPSVVVAMA